MSEPTDLDVNAATAIHELFELVGAQQQVIDLLTDGYRSHQAAILDSDVQIQDLRHRVELLEADTHE